jgi:hypothetical protein
MAFTRLTLGTLALLLAACGREEDPAASMSDEQLRREIEAAATPPVPPEKRPPPPRLAALTAGETAAFVQGRTFCMVTEGDRRLFVTVGPLGLARVDGQLRQLRASGPVAGSGGFFAAEGVSISIGRGGQFAGDAAAYAPDWAAQLSVGGSGSGLPQRFDVRWRCERGAGAAPPVPAP